MLFKRHNSLTARFMLIMAWLAGLLGVLPVSPAYAFTLIVSDNYLTILLLRKIRSTLQQDAGESFAAMSFSNHRMMRSISTI